MRLSFCSVLCCWLCVSCGRLLFTVSTKGIGMLGMTMVQPIRAIMNVNQGPSFEFSFFFVHPNTTLSFSLVCVKKCADLTKMHVVGVEFARYAESGVNILTPKIVFIGFNLVGLGTLSRLVYFGCLLFFFRTFSVSLVFLCR